MNTLASFYQEMFRYSIAPLIFAGAIAACFALTIDRHEQEPARGMPRHELAALAAILFAPPLFFAVAGFWLVTNYSPRYGLLCVIGAAGLMSWLLARITPGQRSCGRSFRDRARGVDHRSPFSRGPGRPASAGGSGGELPQVSA